MNFIIFILNELILELNVKSLFPNQRLFAKLIKLAGNYFLIVRKMNISGTFQKNVVFFKLKLMRLFM